MSCFIALSVSTDSHPQHGRPLFAHRDDRTSKTYERLQKKLKDRQGGGGGGGGVGQEKDSTPPSPQKTCSSPPTVDVHNGVAGIGLEAEPGQLNPAVVDSCKQTARGRKGESGGKVGRIEEVGPGSRSISCVFRMSGVSCVKATLRVEPR